MAINVLENVYRKTFRRNTSIYNIKDGKFNIKRLRHHKFISRRRKMQLSSHIAYIEGKMRYINIVYTKKICQKNFNIKINKRNK